MNNDELDRKLAKIEEIVARVDPRFKVTLLPDGGVQVSDNDGFGRFTLSEYESGDYEVAVRKLVRALAEGMYPGSMFIEMMEQNRLTL